MILNLCAVSRLILLCLLVHAIGLADSDARASSYTPEGLYDPQIYTLGNGMRIILKPRYGARNVAIRLNVGIGDYDFDCKKQETAHFLEHLLFTGTSKHSESELDELIIDHGGTWNAVTLGEDTVFEIDIYSEHADIALQTLHEIITDSEISEDDYVRSRGIIYRELGGMPTLLTRFLHENEIIISARDKIVKAMLAGSRIYCSNLTTLEAISHQDILDAYAKYYVPNNMTLVVTGDFQLTGMKTLINSLFGSMLHKALERDIPVADAFTSGPLEVSGSFKPLFGASGASELVIRTNGYTSPDYYVFQIIEAYFYKRMFEAIRVLEGLSYSPGIDIIENRNEGLFVIEADTEIKDLDRVSEIMQREVRRLRDGEVPDDEIRRTIRALLLSYAQGLESNADIAWHYIDNLDEVEKYGGYVNQEALLEKFTPADVRAVVQRYFVPSNMAISKSSPTLTSNQFYLLSGLVIIILLFFIILLARRMHLRIKITRGRD